MSDLLDLFQKQGYFEVSDSISKQGAIELRNLILKERCLDESLFLTEQQWEASTKTHYKTNPGPGFNIIEKLIAQKPDCLDFVEKNIRLREILEPLLGKDFRWARKKIVYRMPRSNLPSWLALKLNGRLSNTLNAFINPPFRDIAYYLEHDFHQDIIEWNRMPDHDRDHRMITLYVHLDDVISEEDAPLVLLPGTHNFGATPYQHSVKYCPKTDNWDYNFGDGVFKAISKKIYGTMGYGLIFHPLVLHGTHTIKNGYRLILRYTLFCSKAYCGLDKINESISGPLYLTYDYNAGQRIDDNGLWNLQVSDFIRMNPA